MAFSGTGTFSRLFSWQEDRDAGIKIRADRMDQEDDGFADGLTELKGDVNDLRDDLGSTTVRAVADSNVNISSELEAGDTLDGVTLAEDDHVLLTSQSSGSENGIYAVPSSGAASRASSFESYNSMCGLLVLVMEGTTHADTLWIGTSDEGGAIDSDTLSFSQFTAETTFTDLEINDTTGDHQYVFAVNELAADRNIELPLLTGNDVFVFEAHSQTLTNKTLTAPDINGGTADALTSLGIRSTGTGSFDLQIQNTENLTAARALTLTLGDAARTVTLSGNPTLDDWFDQSVKQAASPTFASVTIGASVPFSDASGTLTLQNVDALDATTEATVEGAIDTLANLTSIQGQTVSLSGSLTVEAASTINQDLTTDASPTFAGLTLNGSIGGTGVGIDDGDVLTVDAAAGAPNDDEYARFTANGLEGRTEAEFKADFNLETGTDVQAHDAGLDDISGLAVTDGNFIVADGANWVAESGATVRTSLGLGTGDTPEFTGLTLSGDITDYEAVNDANPQIRLGSADAEELHIQSVFDGGAQTLDYVLFQTDVASATANKGLFRFNVDGADILDIDDGGIDLDSGKALSIAGADVLDATTLGSGVVNSSLTSVGTIATGTWQGTAVDHERGGLEADVSAFTGLLAISGGSTSEVDSKSELEAQIADVSDFAMADGDIYTGTHDFGGADDLEVPNAAAPTIDTDGQVAVDTSVTDFAAGVLKYYSGEAMGVVAMPVAQFGSPSDGDVPTYNATNDQFEMAAGGGGSGAPDDAQYVVMSSDAGLSNERILAAGEGIDVNDGGANSNVTLSSVIRGHIHGCTISNNGTDSDHDIDFATGQVALKDSSDNWKLFSLSSTLTKQIDANWAEGNNAGGFPSGLTLSADTWYHVFAIGKDDGTVDGGFDTDLSATNLLSDASSYSWFRRIGSVLTDGSSNIIAFFQDGDEFLWKQIFKDLDESDPGTGQSAVTLTVPLGVRVRANLAVHYWDLSCSTASGLIVTTPGVGDLAPDFSKATITLVANSGNLSAGNASSYFRTGTSSDINLEQNSSTADHRRIVNTMGWIDPRGKHE